MNSERALTLSISIKVSPKPEDKVKCGFEAIKERVTRFSIHKALFIQLNEVWKF